MTASEPGPRHSLRGEPLVAGRAAGRALILGEPLSLWGGLDPETGEIVDRRHPQSGQSVSGRILVLPWGRGSSSSSSILLEAVRRGTAPLALLLQESDPILVLGAAVALELYRRAPPVLVLGKDYSRLENGMALELHEDGRIDVRE